MASVVVDSAEQTADERRPRRLSTRWRKASLYLVLAGLTFLVWQGISSIVNPIFVPPPADVAAAFVKLTASGDLPENIGVSYFRILVGWTLGCLIAIPLGLVSGRVDLVKDAVQVYVNFFRFIPPIAFIGLALIWFGVGEASKIALIVYTTSFTVFISTMAGALAVDQAKVFAAQSLGASRLQVLRHVVVPATVPSIITGARIAMGFSFMAVIAAELVAAQSGIGFLIYSSRIFLQTQNAFVGIITLGLMGLTADFAFRRLVSRLAYRHGIRF